MFTLFIVIFGHGRRSGETPYLTIYQCLFSTSNAICPFSLNRLFEHYFGYSFMMGMVVGALLLWDLCETSFYKASELILSETWIKIKVESS